jgi:hypothetical protein
MPCWSNWIRRQLIGGSGDGFLSLIYRFLVKGVFCVQGVFFFFFRHALGALLQEGFTSWISGSIDGHRCRTWRFFPLRQFCLLMPLFVFSMVLQVWTVGSGDGYLLWGTVPLQEGHFFVYRGFFRSCSWGSVCRVLVSISAGRFDGVA